MERFKVVEREAKTKAYSKEGWYTLESSGFSLGIGIIDSMAIIYVASYCKIHFLGFE